MLEIKIQGLKEKVILLGDRALYLPARKTVVVSDVHLGKSASFRQRNFFAPSGMHTRDIERLERLIKEYEAERLFVLGDLVHAQDGINAEVIDEFARFRERIGHCRVSLVLGNHDRKVKLPPSWQLEIIKKNVLEDGIVFSHEPLASDQTLDDKQNSENAQKIDFALCGHIHPAAVLTGAARQRERLPCFWLSASPRQMVLPAFGVFTGMYSISPGRADRVFVLADGTVIETKFY